MSGWRVVGAIAAGTALGFLGAYADFTLAAGWHGWWADAIGNTPTGWLVVAALVAWRAKAPWHGAVYGSTALLSAVFTYYLMTYVYAQRGVGPDVLLKASMAWSLAAVACGALVGAAFPFAADRIRWQAVLLCGVVGGALLILPIFEGLKSLIAGPPWGFHSATATEVALSLLAAVVGLAIPAAWPRGRRHALVASAMAVMIGCVIGGAYFVRWNHQRAAIMAPMGIEGTFDKQP